jgi:hypothetical protein
VKASWSKQADGWGVRVDQQRPNEDLSKLQGETITVTKRDGTTSEVTLGARIDLFNGGRAAYYAVPRRKKGEESRQPDTERSDKVYVVRLDVIDVTTGDTVRWAYPIASTDEYLRAETSFEIARTAVHVRDILAGTPVAAFTDIAAETNGSKPKRPSRSRAAAKPKTTRKKVS